MSIEEISGTIEEVRLDAWTHLEVFRKPWVMTDRERKANAEKEEAELLSSTQPATAPKNERRL